MLNKGLFSSEKSDWCTPQDFFDKLNNEFNFDLDVAASERNAKCTKYFTKEEDALTKDWSNHRVFCNPPYGRDISKWVEKAYMESLKPNTLIVLLIPARTDTTYWHEYIFHKAKEIRFIKGRLKFTDESGKAYSAAPFPSAVIIF